MAKAKKSSAKKAAPKKAGAAKAKSAVKALAKKAVGKIKAAVKPAKKTAGKTAAKAPAKKATASKSSSAAPKKAATSSVSTVSSKTKSINWENFLTPLDDRLIVEVSAGEKMTPGGLYIPDTVSDTSGNFKGKVLVSGRGHRDAKGKLHPMEVKAGDVIIFSEYSGAKMDLLDQEVRILRESEVLGIVEKN